MSTEYGKDIQKVTAQMKADSYKMAALSLDARNNILKNVKEALIKIFSYIKVFYSNIVFRRA